MRWKGVHVDRPIYVYQCSAAGREVDKRHEMERYQFGYQATRVITNGRANI